ncbi:sister chromatid cohesion 1 protein 2 [Abeliophyllum distichum]|uniref:Sister chromatid cohesion 1 protein 2 n=1 Tax=Abeliophyllum distichum TaxID=126358 RepID=A0ABD1SK92_9LAMI
MLEHTSSIESMENGPSPSEGLELDVSFSHENKCKNLYRNFLDRKSRNEDEVVNLSEVLEGRTMKESARMFYDILVLKTKDCIDGETRQRGWQYSLAGETQLEANYGLEIKLVAPEWHLKAKSNENHMEEHMQQVSYLEIQGGFVSSVVKTR